MKKFLVKPGFEFIFSLSIMVILGLPPLVFGQTTKDMDISIKNGDTTINGKNIKELSPKEHKEALKEISTISNIQDTKVKVVKVTLYPPDPNQFSTGTDSTHGHVMANNVRVYRFHRDKMNGKDSTINFTFRTDDGHGSEPRTEIRGYRFNRDDGGPMVDFNFRDSQSFNYTNTDKEGVSTHVSFRVSEPSSENLRRVGHFDGAVLNIQDLNLVPQFSTGKTTLMFSLPSKAAAEVQLKDSDGNVLWSAKTTGSDFSKSFVIGLNGTYYLQVKQGSKIAVKKIFKE